jgi:hypothetical protein
LEIDAQTYWDTNSSILLISETTTQNQNNISFTTKRRKKVLNLCRMLLLIYVVLPLHFIIGIIRIHTQEKLTTSPKRANHKGNIKFPNPHLLKGFGLEHMVENCFSKLLVQ